MSYADPYQTPAHVPHKPGLRQLQYMEMFTYVFENPNWLMNLIWGGLCFLVALLIPVVPQLVYMGYQWEVLESLHRRTHRTYPDFDANRLVDYLSRAVWPFLVTLVASVALMAILMPLMCLAPVLGGAVSASGAGDAAGVVVMLLMFVILIPLGIALTFLLIPLVIRSALMQDFAGAFNFEWIKQFISLTWVEMLVGLLFMTVGSMLVAIVGYLLLCIGFLPAAALIGLAYTHFYWQLYEIFLDRGGQPVPLKAPPYPPAYAPNQGLPPQM